MKCECGGKTSVYDSSEVTPGAVSARVRTHKCMTCGVRFKSFEMVQGQRPDPPLAALIAAAASFRGAVQAGWVYVVQNVDTLRVKIGWSATPLRRFRSLETAIGSRVTVLRVQRGTPADERALHKKAAKHRVLGEWFEPAALEVIG